MGDNMNLLDYKELIDNRPTHIATVNKDKYIHSGTGRIARLRMRPMSLYESGYSDGKVSLKDICENTAEDYFTGEVSLDRIINYVFFRYQHALFFTHTDRCRPAAN